MTEVGEPQSVELAGSIAYIGIGRVLTILDVSNTATPARIGYLLLDSSCVDVARSGAFLYCMLQNYPDSWIQIVDVSDPSAPVLIGTSPADGWNVASESNRLYVEHTDTIRVYDVTTPTSPVLLGSCPSDSPIDMVANGNFVYVGGFSSGLQIIDATNAANPVQVGSLPTGFGGHAVAVSGSHAFVLDMFGSAGLYVIDVSSPSSPFQAAFVPSDYGTWVDVAAFGSHAYVLDDYGLVKTFDVSNHASPVPTSSVIPCEDWYAHALSMNGNLLAVCMGEPVNAVCIMDRSDPANPDPQGTYHALPSIHDMDLAGDHLAMAYGNGHLILVNRYDPSSRHKAYGDGWFIDGARVTVNDDHAYVATCDSWNYFDDDAIEVFDIANPTAPIHLAHFPTSQCGISAVTRGNYLYASTYVDLRIIDISTPATPATTGTLSGHAWDLFPDGNHLYMASGSNDLRIADISNPAAPSIVESFAPGGEAESVWVEGNHAFVASAAALWIVDVSDPPNPTIAGSIATTGANDVQIRGGYLYLADDEALRVFEVANPVAPVEVGNITLGSNIYSVVVAPPSIFVRSGGPVIELSTDLITAASTPRSTLELHQNHPNPFTPSTTIEFTLPTGGHTTLEIFDVRGRLVRTLVNESFPAGPRAIIWNGSDANGETVPSGIYFYRLATAGRVETRKMTVLK
ncbi:MAG TPA: T9SS type A sorting domain-containing protein [Candidatus Krumholzibacteria bacterium]|nr:T9SS type A sorting domain-containing protein [Candidatus Krumholzibacteria bacterium]